MDPICWHQISTLANEPIVSLVHHMHILAESSGEDLDPQPTFFEVLSGPGGFALHVTL